MPDAQHYADSLISHSFSGRKAFELYESMQGSPAERYRAAQEAYDFLTAPSASIRSFDIPDYLSPAAAQLLTDLQQWQHSESPVLSALEKIMELAKRV